MDPAAGIFSPFHNETGGKNGLLENAVEELAPVEHRRNNNSSSEREGQLHLKSYKQKDIETHQRGTPCGMCGVNYTSSIVPAGGVYWCGACVKLHEGKLKLPRFPPNTLKCCPASVTEGGEGVVRCFACHGWYHCACLEIEDKTLKEYLALSTTKWYCPDPSCCEKVLQEKLKKKR